MDLLVYSRTLESADVYSRDDLCTTEIMRYAHVGIKSIYNMIPPLLKDLQPFEAIILLKHVGMAHCQS